MAQGFTFIRTLYDDMLSMISKIAVKRPDLAAKYESTNTYRAYDNYRICLQGTQTFYSIDHFDRDILRKYLDTKRTVEALRDRNTIPEEYRADIIRDQAKRILETYEEQNNYYRMLYGLPPIEERVHIFVKDHEGIDPKTPIYKLSDEDIMLLEMDGTLDALRKKYPDAEYLNYLGPNKISFVQARAAKPFEILRLGPPSSNRTRKMFEGEYYAARRYVMASVYRPHYLSQKELYYPIIGILILTLAVRNTLVPTEADYLNFVEILDEILDSYGMLKFFKKFPFTFKRRLVMALDKIIANKGTDGVLIDICELFNFDNFSANRYYLMKTRTKDHDGNIVESDDPEKAYTLQFVKADIQEHEIDMTPENMISYTEVTDNDYLWQLTDEEKAAMLKEDFNLMMTKYLDIEAAYDVTMLSFEVCTFINLILRSKDNLSKVRITNHYSTSGYSTVWTTLVMLLACLAKRSNFDGNIICAPDQMAEILRFNYGDISEALRYVINIYEGEIDISDKLVPGYTEIALEKPNGYNDALDMVKVYVKNRNLYEAILKEMSVTTDERRYMALAKARDLLFYSASEEASFTMHNGEVASTYLEMLNDVDPSLVSRIEALGHVDYENGTMGDLDVDALNDMILYILEKLEDLFDSGDLRYLFMNTPNAYEDLISTYLRTAINVFKAATTQLQSINVFLYLGDHEPVRVIARGHHHTDRYLNDVAHVIDDVATDRTIVLEDYIGCMDKAYVNQ